MKMYKTFYIGLVDNNNNPDEGYNIVNKETGNNYY